MSRNDLVATVTAIVALVITIVATTVIVGANSTQRLEACVSNGGAYINVPNTSRMECQR